MDELDRKIVQMLQKNGRASNAWVAREAGVSEGTVRRRLKRLLNQDIIKLTAVPNPKILGFDTEALIGISVEGGQSERVAKQMSDLPQTTWVSETTGRFDLFTWVSVASTDALGVFLRNEIGTIPGVANTETFVSVSVRKRNSGIIL